MGYHMYNGSSQYACMAEPWVWPLQSVLSHFLSLNLFLNTSLCTFLSLVQGNLDSVKWDHRAPVCSSQGPRWCSPQSCWWGERMWEGGHWWKRPQSRCWWQVFGSVTMGPCLKISICLGEMKCASLSRKKIFFANRMTDFERRALNFKGRRGEKECNQEHCGAVMDGCWTSVMGWCGR